MRAAAVIALAALLAAGCAQHKTTTVSGGTPSPAATHKASPSPPPGPEAFLAIVRKAGLGDKDVANATDNQLLHLARIICDGMDSGVGYQDQIAAFRTVGHGITLRQATIWIDAAVRNMCPAHLSEIPSGAP